MKTANLNIAASPPYQTPMRWFALAPFFLLLAALLLIAGGEAPWLSRWHPMTLALTHLVALGFMGSVMVGALSQVVPFLSGQSWPPWWRDRTWPLWLYTIGVLALVGHFLWPGPPTAGQLLGYGALVALFASLGTLAMAMLWLLVRLPILSDSLRDLRWVAVGAVATLCSALIVLGNRLEPFAALQTVEHHTWVTLHVATVWVGWGLMLVATVGFVVVPMFQLTPSYPQAMRRRFTTALAATLAVVLITGGVTGQASLLASLSLAPLAWSFAQQTLILQKRSKRAKPDATHALWRWAMFATATGCFAIWLAALELLSPLIAGVLIFWGGFAGVICGMWVKIIPFLTWLHLQQMPNRQRVAPTMLKITPPGESQRLSYLWVGALLLLLTAVAIPKPFGPLAGVAVGATALQMARILWQARHLFATWPQS